MEQFFNDLEKAFEEERNKTKDMSEYEKFEYLLKNNRISASSIQRVFSYSYPKAQGIIEELIECGVIKKHQSSYVVVSEPRFYAYISAKTSDKPIDCMGEIIRQEWISFETECKRIAVFTEGQLDEFKQLVKETWLYFKQLNSRKNMPLGSRDGISYYSCMSIINQLYFYSANKIDITDCDYEDYDDLCNYHKATLEITIKYVIIFLYLWHIIFTLYHYI